LLPDGELKTSLAEDLHEMGTMVSAVLESARLEHTAGALSKETVDIGELVSGVAGAFEGRAPGIDVVGGPDVACSLDRERMRTVIRNLLDNALKYSAPESPPVTVSWHRGKDIVLSVADRGVGISPDAIHRVFDPFFREDDSRSRSTGGFGLGLSLCHAIVSAHGGSIDISSAPGEGTTVTLRLPGS
jgi:signal transduction histidine kinase